MPESTSTGPSSMTIAVLSGKGGTGKTFTLSSLMVRILLEKYLPRQVIATTFTRKAAAELERLEVAATA